MPWTQRERAWAMHQCCYPPTSQSRIQTIRAEDLEKAPSRYLAKKEQQLLLKKKPEEEEEPTPTSGSSSDQYLFSPSSNATSVWEHPPPPPHPIPVESEAQLSVVIEEKPPLSEGVAHAPGSYFPDADTYFATYQWPSKPLPSATLPTTLVQSSPIPAVDSSSPDIYTYMQYRPLEILHRWMGPFPDEAGCYFLPILIWKWIEGRESVEDTYKRNMAVHANQLVPQAQGKKERLEREYQMLVVENWYREGRFLGKCPPRELRLVRKNWYKAERELDENMGRLNKSNKRLFG